MVCAVLASVLILAIIEALPSILLAASVLTENPLSRTRNLAEAYSTSAENRLRGVDGHSDDKYISAMVVARFFERVSVTYQNNFLARPYIRTHFFYLFSWWYGGYFAEALSGLRSPVRKAFSILLMRFRATTPPPTTVRPKTGSASSRPCASKI